MGLVSRRARRCAGWPGKLAGVPSFEEALIDRFGALEASFLSEYGIDLTLEVLEEMTWRRFLALTYGLSPDSAWWRWFRIELGKHESLEIERQLVRKRQRDRLGLGPPPVFRHRQEIGVNDGN